MISKRVQPASWFQDRPISTLLNVGLRGFDRCQLEKLAAQDWAFTVDVKPDPRYAYLHLITTGAGEWYGSNNNADWFNKAAGEFRLGNGKTIPLAGGLDEYHSTFMKFAHVYHNHNNSRKGGEPDGDIIAEAVNPIMHRGELIVRLPMSTWGPKIEKMANDGTPIWWSMGCAVPTDACTECGHRAHSRREYCEHLKYAAGSITPKGMQIAAINDIPAFHDISDVDVPADRIAFTLRKVASAGGQVDDEQGGLWVPVAVLNKLAGRRERDRAVLVEKLACMEKRIETEGLAPDEQNMAGAFEDQKIGPELLKRMAGAPLDDLMGAMNKEHELLPPEPFIRIVLKKPTGTIAGLGGLPAAMKGIFGKLKDSPQIDELLNDGSYQPGPNPDGAVIDLARGLKGELSLDPEPVSRRITITIIHGPSPVQKTAGEAPTPETGVLAKEYAKYQLSFLAGAEDDYLTRLVAVRNQIG